MPRNVIIVIISACAVLALAFVGLAVYVGPSDHTGAIEWAAPSNAPETPLLVPPDQQRPQAPPGGGAHDSGLIPGGTPKTGPASQPEEPKQGKKLNTDSG